MKQKTWVPLKEGDLVDIVAPAGRPRAHTLKGIVPFLKSWGLEARIAKDLLGPDMICANSKASRFQNLKQALLAKDSKMIWCLRGGYGSLHLLEDLKKIKPQANKCFLGFSDITSLHTYFTQEWGWSTIHGCNIDRFALNKATVGEKKRFKNILFGKDESVNFKLKPLNEWAQKNKKTKGDVVGGNLITMQSSFGTEFQIKTRGKLLFIEEIGERPYKIDRVFEHMRQLHLFDGVKAIVFGQFTEGQEPNGKNLVPQYLGEFAKSQKIPVFSGVDSGHGGNQHPLPLGTSALLISGKRASLEIQSGAQQFD